MQNSHVVWVSGGSRGIGAAIVEKLFNDNFKVAVSSRSGSGPNDNSGIVKNYKCDVCLPDNVKSTYENIKEDFGRVDVLINNAGTGTFAPFMDLSLEQFDDMMNTNVKGVFMCCRTVLPEMIKRHSGLIINISSVAVYKNFANSSIYSASKAASMAMLNSLRNEIRNQGIKIVNIMPGATATDIWSQDELKSLGESMMASENVADIVYNVIKLSEIDKMMIEDIIIRPQNGDI